MDAYPNLPPFAPTVSKDYQPLVAFFLMAIGLSLTGVFSLNKSVALAPVLAIPASLSLAFGAIYLICAAGVYV